MQIRLDDDGFVSEYATIGYVDDGIEIEMDDKAILEFENNWRAYKHVDGELVYVDSKKIEVEQEQELLELRSRRELECFKKVNRGTLWLNTLTAEQISELDDWYHEWLNVTTTLVVPEQPEWL